MTMNKQQGNCWRPHQPASLPAFAERLAVGNVVRIAHSGQPEAPRLDEFLERSGHSTLRVIVFGAEEELRGIWDCEEAAISAAHHGQL
ncbi:DUF4265 domain-containing protein [Streptomyces sp. UNOB3_S3]|uniref:DUF4265 domain-containing protein n=1 Tax=Streptomyces sp. UNOB3_S3 TaxID=2871682 RepID=UPI001E467D1F|nr:DUF4265 domain-containing protein [Streptomyces sp. UNOB3_S3]MCC3775075.1 DUF4265 domain-containing protein [Streptomyces sp. UNOB3_S3]